MSAAEVLVPGEEIRVPGGARFRREVEARRARRRLYPVSILYTTYGLTVLAHGLESSRPGSAVLAFLLGIAVWTLVEYLVHRYVLHGRSPTDPGSSSISSTRTSTTSTGSTTSAPGTGTTSAAPSRTRCRSSWPRGPAAFLAPVWSVPVFVAGILQAYVVEEWVHHSVHFSSSSERYFRYIKRHHLYHHSPKGMAIAYGLTNGFWDIVYDTRIPRDPQDPLRPAPRAPDALTRASLDLGEPDG